MKTEWVVGFEIKTAYENGEIVISANREGMLSLAKHLTTLADGALKTDGQRTILMHQDFLKIIRN